MKMMGVCVCCWLTGLLVVVLVWYSFLGENPTEWYMPPSSYYRLFCSVAPFSYYLDRVLREAKAQENFKLEIWTSSLGAF